MDTPFVKEGGEIEGDSQPLSAVDPIAQQMGMTVNAQTTIKTKESDESFKIEKKRKKMQEINTLKRERGPAYVEHLENKLNRLTDRIMQLEEDSVKEMVEILDTCENELKKKSLEYMGNLSNESRSEPVNAVGEHGGKDWEFQKGGGELSEEDEWEEAEEPGISEDGDDDDDEDDNSEDNSEVRDKEEK